jgi:hypothetical protein
LSGLSRPVSLAAERAVRFLREQDGPIASVRLAAEILALRAPDESAARRVLEAAFGGDPRLAHGRAGWRLVPQAEPPRADQARGEEPDRALILLRGGRPAPGRPFQLRTVSVLRLRGDDVVAACGGDAPQSLSGQLRRAVGRATAGAAIVVHDPPGALRAFESWLGEPIVAPVSLRRLAQHRLGLPARHDLPALAARLGLVWRENDDPLEQVDVLDACLEALRRPGESLDDLRRETVSARSIDWSRYAFDRAALASIPRVAGTYRFFDRSGKLLYVGKAKDLHRRIGSYFRERARRSARLEALLERIHHLEYEASGSELEAVLREAEQIRRDNPERNVQRRAHPKEGRAARLRSIMILEPAEPPAQLRAYLLHEGRLVARVGLGPRGGGLKRIERLLDDHFFFAPDGPTSPPGPGIDVELVVRWLAANRERAVAFDPTSLRSAREVVRRLRWFLDQGSPFDPQGTPVFPR